MKSRFDPKEILERKRQRLAEVDLKLEGEIKQQKKDFKEFEKKFADKLKINLYDKNDSKDWIRIEGYNEADGLVKIFKEKLPKGQKIENISLEEVEELFKKYTEKTPPTVDAKKKTTAKAKTTDVKTPEELQGEAMEAYIDRNTTKKTAEELQGEAMEAFIDRNAGAIVGQSSIEGSEDEAEERAENTPDKDGEVIFEEVVEDEDEKFKELQSAVTHARMDYSKKNYELTNVFTRLKQFFGKNLTSEHKNMDEENQLLGEYKKALNDLLAGEVEKLKSRKLSPEELAVEMDRLSRYFNQDEKVNLYESRTEARAQVIEKELGIAGRPVGWLMSGAKKFFHWYEKSEGQGAKGFGKGMLKRGSFNAALNAVLIASGLGMTAIFAQRALGATVAGVGATRILEGIYRKKENEKMAAERKIIAEEIEKISDPEEKLARLTAHMQMEMDGYQDDLDRELKNAGKRKIIGFSAGAASAFALGEIAKYIGHSIAVHHGPSSGSIFTQPDVSHDVSQNISQPEMRASNLPSGNSTFEVPKVSGGEVLPNAPEINHTPEVANNSPSVNEVVKTPDASLNGVEVAQKGDSIWKMIGQHFSHNAEFSALNPEQQTYVIDALKDRVASHPTDFKLEDINKIKIGYKFDFSKLVKSEADFHSIIEHAKNLTADQLKNIGHNNQSILDWAGTHHGQVLDSPKVEEILSHTQEHMSAPDNLPTNPSTPLDPVLPRAETMVADKINDANSAPLAMAGAGIGGLKVINKKPIEKNNVVKFPDAAARAERGQEKATQKAIVEFEKMIKDYKLVPGEDAPTRAMKLIKGIAINSKENWDMMKGAKFSGWKKGENVELVTPQGRKLTDKLTKNVRKLVAGMISYSGEKAQPKAEETLFVWIARVTKNSVEKEKVEDLRRAA